MIDTHTHLYSRQYTGENEPDGAAAAVVRSVEAGVTPMVFAAVSLESYPRLLSLADRFPDDIYVSVGIHPSDVKDDWREELAEMLRLAEGKRLVAVGEVGLDLHYGDDNFPLQLEAFEYQLELAMDLGLPVIIHSRDALEPTLEILSRVKERHEGKLPPLVFHSFTGTPDDVTRIREVCDPMFGINGVVTFKNAGELPQAVCRIGLDRLLLETDSPYLAPVPFRGKRNESSMLPAIAQKCADLFELPLKEIESITDHNARAFFRI